MGSKRLQQTQAQVDEVGTRTGQIAFYKGEGGGGGGANRLSLKYINYYRPL